MCERKRERVSEREVASVGLREGGRKGGREGGRVREGGRERQVMSVRFYVGMRVQGGRYTGVVICDVCVCVISLSLSHTHTLTHSR